jgi:hypothetical protein
MFCGAERRLFFSYFYKVDKITENMMGRVCSLPNTHKKCVHNFSRRTCRGILLGIRTPWWKDNIKMALREIRLRMSDLDTIGCG